MPVTWRFDGPVLVVVTSGDYTFEELDRGTSAAMADKRFRPGMPILFDGSQSQAALSSVEIDRRVDRLVSWGRQGLISRCAIVARSTEVHRFGLGRMLALRVEAEGVEGLKVMVFNDADAALAWLRE